MRKFLKSLLGKPIAWLAERVSSSPKKENVSRSLSRLLQRTGSGKKNKGSLKLLDINQDKIIILSDQHKGTRDGADDFKSSEINYLAALEHYYDSGYQFVNLGDCEELWKNAPQKVMACNQACFAAEKKFENKNRYYRVYGNHDLEWKYKLQQDIFLKPVFGSKLKIYEGILFKTSYNNEAYYIFMAHGHQGDQRSDGNPLSAWIVANIWTPIQRYLQISINTPATSFALTDKHNIIMHDWSSAQNNLIFISGHTHKPVFASLDHIDRLTKQLQQAQKNNNQSEIDSIQHELEKRKKEYEGKQEVITNVKPCYFNTGCCCFNDGDITGIEIADGNIRLIKWRLENNVPKHIVLEQAELSYIFEKLG
ncbi:MAG: metallophosphoesterase [Bacteroidetes bacterium]|nr:metallophosphoesterase [Bacteroidota bacterium]MBS1974182.1 metallophosphoesterase [Bacteroidota bacterium]